MFQTKKQEINQCKKSIMEIIKNLFSIQNVILYTIGFFISMVGFSSENLILSIAPFAISFLAAMLSNKLPIGVVYICTLIGTFIAFGPNNLLVYFLTTIVFFTMVLIKQPKEQNIVNEKKKLGSYIFLSVLFIQLIPIIYRQFYLYDLLTSIMLAISSYVFYKIFTNAIPVIKDLGQKNVFSIEEVMGTSLLIAITLCSLREFSIFGFNIKNILSILIVLILGWKNGMLIGTASGVMIGTVLGIIGGSEPILIASYAISGMMAGLFNRLGKIGVIIGFVLGNIALTYVENGNTIPVILIQEILIASLGLLAIPKKIKIDISDLYEKEKLLPEVSLASRSLKGNDDTVLKLNNMSDIINEIATNYQEAASTIVSKEELKEQELSNEEIFKQELNINLLELEENLLYKEIKKKNKIIDDIFKYLLKNEIITEKELIKILENNNNYLVGFYEKDKTTIEDISKMIKAINLAYRMSKLNFIWTKKMDESKKNVSTQLKGVSQAISNLAEEIKEDDNIEPSLFDLQKQEIFRLLKEKNIEVEEIKIKQEESKKYFVEVTTPICNELDGTECNIKKIEKILSKVLKEKFTIKLQECGLRYKKNNCKFNYMSEDKYKIQIGIATSKKYNSLVSGDSHLETKLDDGKYLMVISDGMGSGPEAMKSSKIAVKMLEKLLKAGFNKENSLQIINSTLVATGKEDMYATLDIQILDLFAGNLEFIKNGACPTYLKRGNEVKLLKSVTLPTGIIENNDLEVYDYDLKTGDVLVMCSDGIIDSDNEYINKELWLKYLLEDMTSKNAQQIANIILNEAIDNDYGKQKDDMTVSVVVCQ